MAAKKAQPDFLTKLKSLSLPDDHDMWPEKYRRIQWSNDAQAWELPTKNGWAGTLLEQSSKVQMIDHQGKDEAGTLHERLTFAVIAYREMWERINADDTISYSTVYQDGYKSRVHFLALCQEAEDLTPAIITVGGYTAAAMVSGYSQYRQALRNITKTLTGQASPGYIFWAEFSAGEKVMVGNEKQSAIYPPTVVMPDLTDNPADVLQGLYIGDEAAELIANILFDEAQAWVAESPALLTAGQDTYNGVSPLYTIEVAANGSLDFPPQVIADRSKLLDMAVEFGAYNDLQAADKALRSAVRLSSAKTPDEIYYEAYQPMMVQRWQEMQAADRQMELAR